VVRPPARSLKNPLQGLIAQERKPENKIVVPKELEIPHPLIVKMLEFIWIMGGYQACSRKMIKDLIGTPNMKKPISGKREVMERLLKGLGE
jgi:hypothetical protein